MSRRGRVQIVPEKILIGINTPALRAVGDIGETVIFRIRGEAVKEAVNVEAVKRDRDAFIGERGDRRVELGF